MLLKQIHCQNLLSFGPDSKPLELRPLNILIGPNGSGKSNLIDAISVLQAVPTGYWQPIRQNGGISEWLWKGPSTPIPRRAEISVTVFGQVPFAGPEVIHHSIAFTAYGDVVALLEERIDCDGQRPDSFISSWHLLPNRRPPLTFAFRGQEKTLDDPRLDLNSSIVPQFRNPTGDMDLTYLGWCYERIKTYREWAFGRSAPLRQPQSADDLNNFVKEDYSNLGLVLSRIKRKPEIARSIVGRLNAILPDVQSYDVVVEGGTVQVGLQEGDAYFPASRLSDGTLRFLALLTILCDPDPPGLICLEEPELGMHPDVIPTIADLLKEASQRTQLIVTTHSPMLVDCFNSTPEDIVVCEKHDGQTQMNRLDPEELKHWLESFSLGKLWSQGNIGGNRW